jgi:hypothetical protein
MRDRGLGLNRDKRIVGSIPGSGVNCKKKKKESGQGGLNGYSLKQTGQGSNGFFWGESLNGSGRNGAGRNPTHIAPLPSLQSQQPP